jgi:hypothetical protein
MDLEPILVVTLNGCRAVTVGEFSIRGLTTVSRSRGVRPWHLKELSKRGLIVRTEGTKGGHRAYYRLLA